MSALLTRRAWIMNAESLMDEQKFLLARMNGRALYRGSLSELTESEAICSPLPLAPRTFAEYSASGEQENGLYVCTQKLTCTLCPANKTAAGDIPTCRPVAFLLELTEEAGIEGRDYILMGNTGQPFPVVTFTRTHPASPADEQTIKMEVTLKSPARPMLLYCKTE